MADCCDVAPEESKEPVVAVAARTDLAFQQCISPACGATFSVDEVLTSCPSCGNLLDVAYDWDRLRPPTSFEVFERKWMRRSSFRSLRARAW
jgi:threonine synthase